MTIDDVTDERKGSIAAVLARRLGGIDPEVPRALAREILNVLPELYIQDHARQQVAATQTLIADVTAELGRRPWEAPLPPPGTSLSQALQAQARVLRQTPAAMSGSYASGYEAGRDAFLRELEGRAAGLTAGADQRRPGPAGDAVEAGYTDSAPSGPRAALAERLAQLPADPQERRAHQRAWVGRQLLRFHEYSGIRTGELADAVADLVLQALPDLDLLDSTLDTLAGLEADLLDLRRQLADAQAECGLTGAEIQWRNRLAAELRHRADGVTGNAGGGSDPFAIGFDLANQSMAHKLRRVADEIAIVVPHPTGAG